MPRMRVADPEVHVQLVVAALESIGALASAAAVGRRNLGHGEALLRSSRCCTSTVDVPTRELMYTLMPKNTLFMTSKNSQAVASSTA